MQKIFKNQIWGSNKGRAKRVQVALGSLHRFKEKDRLMQARIYWPSSLQKKWGASKSQWQEKNANYSY
jgi:hypothetical protein